MMTPGQTFAEIQRLLERAMVADIDPRDLRGLLIQAHTHAVIQGVYARRSEARATFAAFPELEHGPVQ